MESALTFAARSGWPLIAVLALVLLVGVLVESNRLLMLSVVAIEALLVFWVYSLWRLV